MITPDSPEEWDLETRAFYGANNTDVPGWAQEVIQDLWREVCARAPVSFGGSPMTDVSRYQWIIKNKAEIIPDGIKWTNEDKEEYISPFRLSVHGMGVHGRKSLDEAIDHAIEALREGI